MLVCFLRSLVSHCPVFPPWLWSHWPLFGDILPQEPSLALPSPSPRRFFQTYSEREHRPYPPICWDPSPKSQPIPPSFIQQICTEHKLCARHWLGRLKGPVSLLWGTSPLEKTGAPGMTVPWLWEFLTASGASPLSQVLRVEEEFARQEGGRKGTWDRG